MTKRDDLSRRTFLKSSFAATVGASVLGGSGVAHAARRRNRSGIAGVAMVTSREHDDFRVDLMSLTTGDILHTFRDFHAAHAVVTVEGLNRLFVHGRDKRTGKGALTGVEVDPATEQWRVLDVIELEGGMPLHWQPNRGHTLIQYNTVGD